jgi:hypothetical protein
MRQLRSTVDRRGTRTPGPCCLQIFRLDFASTDADLKLAGGAVQAPERFCRVCWGPPGLDSKTYPVSPRRCCCCCCCCCSPGWHMKAAK